MIGERFGRLEVVAEAGRDKWQKALWRCACACGGETATTTHHLRSGHTQSCGCLRRERTIASNSRHGHARRGLGRRRPTSATYRAWSNMIQRCTNPNNNRWADWGGRGITVCERWRSDFTNFLADMGEKPDGLTLDRIDNDAGYSPGNCRWATTTEQNRNQRPRVAA